MKQFFERWVNTALHDYTLTVVLCMAVGFTSVSLIMHGVFLIGLILLSFAIMLMEAIREAGRRRDR